MSGRVFNTFFGRGRIGLLHLAALVVVLCLGANPLLASDHRVVAFTRGLAPPGSGVTEFVRLQTPLINNAGQIAFEGAANAHEPGYLPGQFFGLWTEQDGAFEMVARVEAPAPGAGPGAIFGMGVSGNGDPYFSKTTLLTDQGYVGLTPVVIRSEYDLEDPLLSIVDGTGFYSNRGGGLAPVFFTGEHFPGLPENYRLVSSSTIGMTSSGQVAFRGTAFSRDDPIRGILSGIWVEEVGGWRNVVIEEATSTLR